MSLWALVTCTGHGRIRDDGEGKRGGDSEGEGKCEGDSEGDSECEGDSEDEGKL